jgi:hypothetical protein
MLAVSWIYMIHNLLMTYLSLEIIRQLFYIRIGTKVKFIFVLWIQVVFIFNDFVIEANYPLEYKYLTIFIGFLMAYFVVLKMSIVASGIILVINLAVNGIATNLNIFVLLLNQFDSYGLALESDFIQYSSLVMVVGMVFMTLKTFNVRILDISKYQ